MVGRGVWPETRCVKQRIRVLVVDDSSEFVAGVESWISAQPDLELVGTAFDGSEATEAVERLEPDLVLMDAVMPEVNGFQATRWIKEKPGAPRVVILTLHDSATAREQAEAAGADGFVAKHDLWNQLPRVIRGD